LGAYSKSHRPTITGGVPNSRNAWAMARVNAFLRKAGGGKAKKTYVQDDDLLKMHLGGDMSKHLAPNGKPSNLTHEQWHLVRTPEFKAWFGDWEKNPKSASKVVDDNGEPMVVYHGSSSSKKFYKFKLDFATKNFNNVGDPIGFYFSSNVQYAYGYAKNTMTKQTGTMYEVFLNLRNPLVVSNELIKNSKKPNKLRKPYSEVKRREYSKFKPSINDGFIAHFDSFRNEYVAIYSNQIKLADGSNTTFDSNNPDIRYADGGEIDKFIEDGIVELKMYDTTNEHSKIYGFDAQRPLYIQSINVSKEYRGKGIGSKVMQYIIDYANINGNDVIFGHITQKAEPSIDVIKSMIVKSGFNTCDGNNDFYKLINITDDKYSDSDDVGQEIKCRRCGWHWNTNQSEDFDKYICHNCGFDNRTYYDADPIGFKGGGIVKDYKGNEYEVEYFIDEWKNPYEESGYPLNVVIYAKINKNGEDKLIGKLWAYLEDVNKSKQTKTKLVINDIESNNYNQFLEIEDAMVVMEYQDQGIYTNLLKELSKAKELPIVSYKWQRNGVSDLFWKNRKLDNIKNIKSNYIYYPDSSFADGGEVDDIIIDGVKSTREDFTKLYQDENNILFISTMFNLNPSKIEYYGDDEQTIWAIEDYNRMTNPYSSRDGKLKESYMKSIVSDIFSKVSFRKFGNEFRKHIDKYFSSEYNIERLRSSGMTFQELASYIIGDGSYYIESEQDFRNFAKAFNFEIPKKEDSKFKEGGEVDVKQFIDKIIDEGCKIVPLTSFQIDLFAFLDSLKNDCISLGGLWYDSNPTNYAYSELGNIVLFDIEDFYNENDRDNFIKNNFPIVTPLEIDPFDDDNYEFIGIGEGSMGGVFRDKRDNSILKITASPFEVVGTTKVFNAQKENIKYENNFVEIYSIQNIGRGIFKGTWYYKYYKDKQWNGNWFAIRRANVIPFDKNEQNEANCVNKIIKSYYSTLYIKNYAPQVFGSYDMYEPNREYQNYVNKLNNRFADGGEVEEHKETYKKWKSLVNMSKSELEKFYNSEEGKKAGLTPSQAKASGIDSGRESARWIMRMKDTPVSEWTSDMWRWAKKQISFISRMSGNKGPLFDDKGRKTRKYLSLLIWGNDPKKYKSGGTLGKYAFADKYNGISRIARKLQKTKEYEADNATEEKILDLLNHWTNRPDNAKQIYDKRDLLKKVKKEYPEVFKPNFNGLIYRGLSSLPKEIKNSKDLKLDFEKVIINGDAYFLYKNPIEYTPNKNVESWTTSLKIANSFGSECILVSKLDDNFYFKPEFINAIYYGRNEDEILHLGKDFTKNIYVMISDMGFRDILEYQVKENKSYVLNNLKYDNGGTINQSKNNKIMDNYKFNQLPLVDTLRDKDHIVIKESVFAGNIDKPKHLGERYIHCEVMSKGGVLNDFNLKVINSVGANPLEVGKIIQRPIANVLTKGRKLIVEPIVNAVPNFKKGGLNPDNKEVKQYFAHDSGNAGGVLVGKRHSEGGIKAINNSTGQPLEMEGGEVVITRNAVSNPKKYQFQGKDMTTREILSKLNVDGGGVSFAEGGDVPEKMNCGCDKMDFGGTTMSIQDFINRSDSEYQTERLKVGIQKERADHYDTLSKLNAGTITIEQALREIAQKEMKLDSKYPFAN